AAENQAGTRSVVSSASGRISLLLESKQTARHAPQAQGSFGRRQGSMKIYLLRHGTAEPRGPGKAEAARALTPDGRVEVDAVARGALKGGKIPPEAIITSPWSRALTTAQIAAKVIGCENLVETKSLLPDVPPAQLWKEIRQHREAKELMVVGHEPHLSRFA